MAQNTNIEWTARDQLRQMICEDENFDYTKIFEEVEYNGETYADISNEGADALANHFMDFYEILHESHSDLLKPIDMILLCPKCGFQHIDRAEEVCREPAPCRRPRHHTGLCSPFPETAAWTNPPHKSHLCHNCGVIWRPADVTTNGVAAIKTRGSDDNWPEVTK